MKLNDAIFQRRSIRHYEKDFQIPTTDLEQILKAAMSAPSAMNKQPWEFIVLTDKEALAKVQNNHPYASFLSDAGTGIIVCVDLTREYNGMGIIDVTLASQNLMLEAHALGYGTCYCGVYPEHTDTFLELLDLPEHIIPIGLIALGKPSSPISTTVKERFDPTRIHINSWE